MCCLEPPRLLNILSIYTIVYIVQYSIAQSVYTIYVVLYIQSVALLEGVGTYWVTSSGT